MRCDCCNALLSDKEATRKFKESGAFTNACDRCLRDIPLDTVTRHDLEEEKYEIDADFREDTGDWDDEED